MKLLFFDYPSFWIISRLSDRIFATPAPIVPNPINPMLISFIFGIQSFFVRREFIIFFSAIVSGLGNIVPDYHNGSSTCKDEDGVETGNTDDIKGLIKFIRGYDYFAYEGCSNITKVRSSVLGDIYHSQLIEVGKPEANTFFTANNQEAYWRSMNGYRSFALNNENRARVRVERSKYLNGNSPKVHLINANMYSYKHINGKHKTNNQDR